MLKPKAQQNKATCLIDIAAFGPFVPSRGPARQRSPNIFLPARAADSSDARVGALSTSGAHKPSRGTRGLRGAVGEPIATTGIQHHQAELLRSGRDTRDRGAARRPGFDTGLQRQQVIDSTHLDATAGVLNQRLARTLGYSGELRQRRRHSRLRQTWCVLAGAVCRSPGPPSLSRD